MTAGVRSVPAAASAILAEAMRAEWMAAAMGAVGRWTEQARWRRAAG